MEVGSRAAAARILKIVTVWPIGPIVPVQDPTPFSPFAPAEWTVALKTVATCRFEGVELAITEPSLLDSTAVAEALAAEGLRLLSITTGQAAAKEGLSLSSSSETVQHRAIERIRNHMKLAAGSGGVVIIGSLRGAEGNIDVLVNSIRACARFEPSVRLALEPLNRYESQLLNTVSETLDVIERVGEENVGILFDTFHANIEEASPEAAVLAAGDRLFHVHLADSNRWPPGYGHFDYSEIWESLDRIAYSGALVLEPLPLPNADELLHSGQRIRSWWGSQAAK